MKYVSVIARPRSPFFRVAYFCPTENRRVWVTTEFRVDDPQGRRKALNWASEKSKAAVAAVGAGGTEQWSQWARPYIESRYAGRAITLPRMLAAWDQWELFLTEKKVPGPRALDYNKVAEFVTWRMSRRRRSGKTPTKNTALADTRAMSVVMREACRRGYADRNPCERLGITRDRVKEKCEISAEETVRIRTELETRPAWMQVSFEIALHQGCRQVETAMPMDHIDLQARTIRFVAKGRNGEPHVFTTRLHGALVPMLQQIKDRGEKVTCVLPPRVAFEWHRFFKEIGLPHLCFHCTRVTAVTKLARAGVPIQQAMAYIGHSSEAVHRIYQKLAAQDLSKAEAALSY